MAIVKSPITFKDQVSKLESKNVVIPDKAKCELFFSKNNYYRFSAYLLPFIDKATGICSVSVSFDEIVDIYNFDKELRHLFSRLIENIEIDLRTKIAYYFSHKYGPLGYTQAANFNNRYDYVRFSNDYHKCISENSMSPVVIHHNNKYGGNFPLWVIIEYFHLGMLSHFYAGMQIIDQKAIAKEYNTSYQNILSWFKCLNDLRNRCAHYSRLYFWVFTAVPKQDRTWNVIPNQTLFTQILMLKSLSLNSEEWNDFFIPSLRSAINKHQSINLKHIGFPNDWEFLLR